MGSFTLEQLCIRKVIQNMDVLESKVDDLPASLLKELISNLNLYYLDRIEKAAQLKGVSCSFAWSAKWRDMTPGWRCILKLLQPEKEDWKQLCLESYFHAVLFRPEQMQSSSFDKIGLSVAAEYVRDLNFSNQHEVQKLASDELQPILAILEKKVRTLRLFDSRVCTEQTKSDTFFVLHRLLDHGSVKNVVLASAYDSHFVRWIVSKCKGTSWIGDGPAPSKYPRLQPLVDEIECSRSVDSCRTNVTYPEGQIHSLHLDVRSLSEVIPLLPSWLGLRSLRLSTLEPVSRKEVVDLGDSLRKLFQNPHCSLKDLMLSDIYVEGHLASFLMSCPTLQTLSLQFDLHWDSSSTTSSVPFTPNMQLSLEKLTLMTFVNQTMQEYIPAVLQHAPKLSTLYIRGIIGHPHALLRTLPESNPFLKVLFFRGINLADCQNEVIYLLEKSMLEELSFIDCRLLESTEQKDFLVRLIASVKNLCSLRSLSLARNQLASSVIEAADLFLDNPGNIIKLDLSSNSILPVDLLKFSRRIKAHKPLHRFTLDLQDNPLTSDHVLKDEALNILRQFCDVLIDERDLISVLLK